MYRPPTLLLSGDSKDIEDVKRITYVYNIAKVFPRSAYYQNMTFLAVGMVMVNLWLGKESSVRQGRLNAMIDNRPYFSSPMS